MTSPVANVTSQARSETAAQEQLQRLLEEIRRRQEELEQRQAALEAQLEETGTAGHNRVAAEDIQAELDAVQAELDDLQFLSANMTTSSVQEARVMLASGTGEVVEPSLDFFISYIPDDGQVAPADGAAPSPSQFLFNRMYDEYSGAGVTAEQWAAYQQTDAFAVQGAEGEGLQAAAEAGLGEPVAVSEDGTNIYRDSRGQYLRYDVDTATFTGLTDAADIAAAGSDHYKNLVPREDGYFESSLPAGRDPKDFVPELYRFDSDAGRFVPLSLDEIVAVRGPEVVVSTASNAATANHTTLVDGSGVTHPNGAGSVFRTENGGFVFASESSSTYVAEGDPQWAAYAADYQAARTALSHGDTASAGGLRSQDGQSYVYPTTNGGAVVAPLGGGEASYFPPNSDEAVAALEWYDAATASADGSSEAASNEAGVVTTESEAAQVTENIANAAAADAGTTLVPGSGVPGHGGYTYFLTEDGGTVGVVGGAGEYVAPNTERNYGFRADYHAAQAAIDHEDPLAGGGTLDVRGRLVYPTASGGVVVATPDGAEYFAAGSDDAVATERALVATGTPTYTDGNVRLFESDGGFVVDLGGSETPGFVAAPEGTPPEVAFAAYSRGGITRQDEAGNYLTGDGGLVMASGSGAPVYLTSLQVGAAPVFAAHGGPTDERLLTAQGGTLVRTGDGGAVFFPPGGGEPEYIVNVPNASLDVLERAVAHGGLTEPQLLTASTMVYPTGDGGYVEVNSGTLVGYRPANATPAPEGVTFMADLYGRGLTGAPPTTSSLGNSYATNNPNLVVLVPNAGVQERSGNLSPRPAIVVPAADLARIEAAGGFVGSVRDDGEGGWVADLGNGETAIYSSGTVLFLPRQG